MKSSTTSSSGSTIEAERALIVKTLAADLLHMLLPALLKMSKTAVRKSLEDEQVKLSRVTCCHKL